MTGRLIYVMGPSGAGKDTLLAYARAHLEHGVHSLASQTDQEQTNRKPIDHRQTDREPEPRASANQTLSRAPLLFAHRYITRAADAGGENHIALSEAEFACRSAQGLFALEWRSHGLRYGIGREIDLWLARGATVVVSASRGSCRAAFAAYPAMQVVLIEAELAVLARRLAARGRESEAQVRERLACQPAFDLPAGARLTRIDNSGALATGGDALLRALQVV
jgi:ribose 1,5-bisphosphokinase